MSVATKNPFAILDDDQPSEPSPPPQTDATPAAVPPQNNNRTNQKSKGPAARGGKYYPRGGGKPQARDGSDEPAAAAAAAADDSQRKFEGARDGRGRGRGRGRGTDGRGRGRPFDKHSQTGRTDSDKKFHQGWGGDNGNAEFKTEQAATVDAAVESGANDWNADPATPAAAAADWAGTGDTSAAADPWATPAAAPTDSWDAPSSDPVAAPAADNDRPEGRPRRERDAEEEDNTLTLSQYLAQQKEKESAIPKLENTRKANEGAGDDLWKDQVPLSKNEEEDAYFVGKSKSAPKARPKKEEKVYLEIEARFERPSRGRAQGRVGDRGGGRVGDRGGDRVGDRGGDKGRVGDRGRGSRGGRGGVGTQNGSTAINVDDQAAFPSLT